MLRPTSTAPSPTVDWQRAPLSALVDHIVTAYHGPLRTELPRLEGLARKAMDVHGDQEPRFEELYQTFRTLQLELDTHMMKEEQVLFPMILSVRLPPAGSLFVGLPAAQSPDPPAGSRAGQGAMAGLISVMEAEHVSTLADLDRLRQLTDNFQVSVDACKTVRTLWLGLERLDLDLREHVRVENDILHARALG